MAKAFDKEQTKPRNGEVQTFCDYVKLLKVWFDDKKVKKSKADRKLKKWQKGWIVVTIESIPENSTLKCYKTEEQWLTSSKSKNVICEPLNDIVYLKKIQLPGKPYILAVVFSSHSLWLSFKSLTSLTMWMEKLSHITKRYLVQLVKSTNEAIKPATYLLHVHSNKITGYRTAHDDLEESAWSWDISTFYAYRVHKRVITEIEIIIGKDSDLEGHFHFIGPELEHLCKCILEGTANQGSKNPCLKDTLHVEKMATIGSNLTVGSNPSYMTISRSPSLFICDSDSESDDDGYVNDDTMFNLRKLMPSPLENADTTTTIGSNLTIDSNPGYLSLSHSPSLFICESDSESDDGYVNDDTVQNLKKLMLSPEENEYIELASLYVENDYERERNQHV